MHGVEPEPVAARSQGEADRFAQRALLVTISGASNADVDPTRGFTIVSEASPSQLGLTFDSAINQVLISALDPRP